MYLYFRNDQSDVATMLNLIASSVLSKEEYSQWKDFSRPKVHTNQISYDNDEVLLINGFLNSKVCMHI